MPLTEAGTGTCSFPSCQHLCLCESLPQNVILQQLANCRGRLCLISPGDAECGEEGTWRREQSLWQGKGAGVVVKQVI